MTANGRAASSAAEVEGAIGHTRAELALTVDAIGRRLDARHYVEKGLDMLNDALTTGDVLNRSLGVIRANPVPFVLFGIGAAWLAASNTGVVDRLAQDERVEAVRRRAADLATGIGNRAGEIASDMADRVGLGATSSSSDQPLGHTGNPMVDQQNTGRPDGWVHRVSDMAQDALRSVRDSGGAAMNRAGIYAGDGAGRIADQVTDTLQRHPIVVGAIGVMAGALIAALMPLTRTEHDWIGGTRDELWNRAEEVGQEAVSRLREATAKVANRAGEAASATLHEEMAKPLNG